MAHSKKQMNCHMTSGERNVQTTGFIVENKLNRFDSLQVRTARPPYRQGFDRDGVNGRNLCCKAIGYFSHTRPYSIEYYLEQRTDIPSNIGYSNCSIVLVLFTLLHLLVQYNKVLDWLVCVLCDSQKQQARKYSQAPKDYTLFNNNRDWIAKHCYHWK